MNKRELVRQAIAHRETERVPYCVMFTDEAEALIRPHYPEGDLQLAVGNDVYLIGPPWWDWYNVPDSYRHYEAPDTLPMTRGRGCYEQFFEKCKRIRGETDCYLLATIWGSHFEKAYFARGIENFLADLAGEPEFSQRLLDSIIRKNLVMLEAFITCDELDGVLLGSDWGSQKSLLMSPAIWRERIKPGEMKEYALIKEARKDVWIHSCGNVEAILPDLAEMGVDVLNPLQPECMDISDIKSRFGDKLAFWGGISTQQTLPNGTPDEVRAVTRQTILEMSGGGGYIAAPSQSLQDDVPVENVLALLSELVHYRRPAASLVYRR